MSSQKESLALRAAITSDYKRTEKFKEDIRRGQSSTIPVVLETIERVISDRKEEPMGRFNALRLLKECVEINNEAFNYNVELGLLNRIYEFAASLDVRTLLGNECEKISRSFYVLCVECILVWAAQFPRSASTGQPSQFAKVFHDLKATGIKFPSKLNYFKEDELVKFDPVARAEFTHRMLFESIEGIKEVKSESDVQKVLRKLQTVLTNYAYLIFNHTKTIRSEILSDLKRYSSVVIDLCKKIHDLKGNQMTFEDFQLEVQGLLLNTPEIQPWQSLPLGTSLSKCSDSSFCNNNNNNTLNYHQNCISLLRLDETSPLCMDALKQFQKLASLDADDVTAASIYQLESTLAKRNSVSTCCPYLSQTNSQIRSTISKTSNTLGSNIVSTAQSSLIAPTTPKKQPQSISKQPQQQFSAPSILSTISQSSNQPKNQNRTNTEPSQRTSFEYLRGQLTDRNFDLFSSVRNRYNNLAISYEQFRAACWSTFSVLYEDENIKINFLRVKNPVPIPSQVSLKLYTISKTGKPFRHFELTFVENTALKITKVNSNIPSNPEPASNSTSTSPESNNNNNNISQTQNLTTVTFDLIQLAFDTPIAKVSYDFQIESKGSMKSINVPLPIALHSFCFVERRTLAADPMTAANDLAVLKKQWNEASESEIIRMNVFASQKVSKEQLLRVLPHFTENKASAINLEELIGVVRLSDTESNQTILKRTAGETAQESQLNLRIAVKFSILDQNYLSIQLLRLDRGESDKKKILALLAQTYRELFTEE